MPATKEVTLKIADESWIHASFDPSIKGVDPITRQGTSVPSRLAASIVRDAKSLGITIEKTL